jgi:hypothetical protein
MSRQLVGSYTETEQDFLSVGNAEELGVCRIFYDPKQRCLMKAHYLFLFTDGKDGQTTLQILQQCLSQVQGDREKAGLPPMTELRIWSDNANDLKGGQIFDQWKKILGGESNVEGGLSRLRLQYHAKNEGKTMLDGFFGRQAGAVARYERSGKDRRDLDDLFNVYTTIETSHVFIVDIDRKEEGVFYRTAAGISDLHSVEITSGGIQGQVDSRSEMQNVDLGKVKVRQTKAVKERQLKKQEAMLQAIDVSPELCQKCQHSVKKGEDLSEWLHSVSDVTAPGTRPVLGSHQRRLLRKLRSRIARIVVVLTQWVMPL